MRRMNKKEDSSEDIQNWIAFFHHITFPTVIIPLSKETAVAYLADYRYRYCSAPLPPSEQHINLLNQLIEDINRVIITNFQDVDQQNSYFLRLTSRSPKDGIQFDLSTFLERTSNIPSPNEKLKLYFSWITNLLQISNGNDGLTLLKHSERVYFDILQAIEADEDSDPTINYPWNLGICIRKWDDRINDQWEFRCFIFNYQLVAISQYNTYIYCSDLHPNKQSIQTLIQLFYLNYIQLILYSINKPNCILDVAIFPTLSNTDGGGSLNVLPTTSEISSPSNQTLEYFLQYILVIELNPYNKRTGGGCFRWDVDHNILFNGNGNDSGEEGKKEEEGKESESDQQQKEVVFRLVGEEEAFDMSEFNKRQENVLEGFIAECEILEYSRQQREEKEKKRREEEEKRRIAAEKTSSPCSLM